MLMVLTDNKIINHKNVHFYLIFPHFSKYLFNICIKKTKQTTIPLKHIVTCKVDGIRLYGRNCNDIHA